MIQLRFVFCFLLIAIIAVSAITVKPLKDEGHQQSLLDVDSQGHENTGERLARQYYGRGRDYRRRDYYRGRDYYRRRDNRRRYY